MSRFPVTDRTEIGSPALPWAYPSFCASVVLFGGGGVAYGYPNLVVQLLALAMLAAFPGQLATFRNSAPRALIGLAILSLALPAAHLVPLPEAVWTSLPRRDLVIASLEATGGSAGGWRPLSVDPARTLIALLGLIAPLAVIVLGIGQRPAIIARAALAVVVAGLANFVLGIPQVLGGTLVLYPENPMPGVLFGSFANRSSAAVFLVCCLCLLATMPCDRDAAPLRRAGLALAAGLLALGTVLTASRSGIVLLAIPALLGAGRVLVARERPGLTPQRLLAGAGIGLALAALIAVAAGPGSRIETALDRFQQTDNPRADIWEDARYSAGQFWPAGSGMGTFDEVFQLDESLENLSERTAGRAHNDYLELAIEAGPFGLILAFGWLVFVLARSWQLRRAPYRWQAWGGGAMLLVVALQSVSDYPLRSQAMLAVAAFAIVLLSRLASSRTPAP